MTSNLSNFHFNAIRVPQREYKVREPLLLKVGHMLFVLFGRKLAGVVFEDGLHGLIRGDLKENDRRDVFSERFRDAGSRPTR